MGDSKDDWLHLEGRYTNLLYPILGSSWNLGRGRLCFSIYENYQINELRTMAMHVRRASPRGPGGQYTANEVTRLRQHSSFGTIISSPAEHPPVPHEDSLTKHLCADTYSSLCCFATYCCTINNGLLRDADASTASTRRIL
jgi:hypothetical protein